jgi:hypothetical protein
MHTLAFFLLAFSTSAIAQTKVFCDPPMQDRGFTLPAHPCNGLTKSLRLASPGSYAMT